MKTNRLTPAAAILATIILSASLPAKAGAQATTYTWTGGNGASDSWYAAGNWGGTIVPADEPPSDYVFAAGGWNTGANTIAIDGANRAPYAQTLTVNGNVGVPLTVQIGQDNTLWLSPSTSGATTITAAQTGVQATIAGSSGASIQLTDDQQWSVAGTLDISAVIWDDGELPSPGFVKNGAGTLILSGNNAFSGPITVDQGTVSVSTIANQGAGCNLGRGSLTLGGGALAYNGSSVATNRGFALGTGGGAIDVANLATSLTFTGAVTGGQVALTKTGGGTLILTGADSYTGLTTVSAGALVLGASAQNPVLGSAGAGASVTGGQLVFDYTAGADPASTIEGLLGKKINGSPANPPLICCDNTVADTVTVESALPGDANLDGKVDINDLTIVLANYNQTGKTWSTGDFTGDGTVDINDLTIVLANYGQTFGSSPAGMASVPEPASAALLVAGLIGLLIAWGKGRW
jgi:autotransporter-associated beta strand protein